VPPSFQTRGLRVDALTPSEIAADRSVPFASRNLAAVEPDDQTLVAAHLAGDPAAFTTLVRRYQLPVYRLALRYARDPDEAEELAQRTFLRAFSRAGSLGARESFRAWLFRVAANLCKNHLRDRAKLVLGVPLALPAPDEGEPLEAAQRRARVREALARLPLRQRQVVSLRIDAELPFSQVAESLGITENNAKVTYHNAVKRLREQLGQEDL
jgi:RNA polymerase sigma-70 factor (ECF subfamily)